MILALKFVQYILFELYVIRLEIWQLKRLIKSLFYMYVAAIIPRWCIEKQECGVFSCIYDRILKSRHIHRPMNWVPPLMKCVVVRTLLSSFLLWNSLIKKSLISQYKIIWIIYALDSFSKYNILWIWILNSPTKDYLQFCSACLIFKTPFCSKGFHSLGPDFLNCCHMSFFNPPAPFFFKRKASGLYHEGLFEAILRG